jgi:hypothetical protein
MNEILLRISEGMILNGEYRTSRRKAPSGPTLFTKIPTWTCYVSNVNLSCESSATNYLSHGTDIITVEVCRSL